MTQRFAVVLAAGKGTRMKSTRAKVLHEVAHRPMITRVLDAVAEAAFDAVYTVVSPDATDVIQAVASRGTKVVTQAEQLGTGHAVLQTAPELADKSGTTLVLCGDTPLITAETLNKLVAFHETHAAKATILTGMADDPFGYGRIVRDSDGNVQRIVEEKDADDATRAIHEVNTGIYVFDNAALFDALKQVTNDNAQGEYYLPDVIQILQQQGETIAAHIMDDFSEAMGVNTQQDLARANQRAYARTAAHWLAAGVTIEDPSRVWIDEAVTIAPDTVIEPDVRLLGDTKIGAFAHIGSQSVLRDATIADHVTIRSSEIEQASVGRYSDVGPMAHLRPHAEIKEHVHIGNFVEVKNSVVGDYTKVGHLTYIGDADLGQSINVSCGVIFSNYDGNEKHRSTVGDHSFIGANVTIISPVRVADHSFLAAGSTITDDVNSRDLAIARARQTNKEDYWYKLAVAKNPDNE